jgi:hypothetical protein
MTDPFWANRFNNAEFQIMPLRTSLALQVLQKTDATIRHNKSENSGPAASNK